MRVALKGNIFRSASVRIQHIKTPDFSLFPTIRSSERQREEKFAEEISPMRSQDVYSRPAAKTSGAKNIASAIFFALISNQSDYSCDGYAFRSIVAVCGQPYMHTPPRRASTVTVWLAATRHF